MSKVKINFVLPEGLQKDLQEQMISEGYGLKGKSKWVSESLERLFQFNDFMQLVKVNDEMSGFEKMECVLIEKPLKTALDQAVLKVKRSYPELDGVQSMVMRTAILQRLL